MAETNPEKALHFSTGKPGIDQIPVEILLEWGQVFSYGEQKYFRDNWRRGSAATRMVGSGT
jgi:hypothetical protein